MNDTRYVVKPGYAVTEAEAAKIGPELLAIDNLPLPQAVQYIRRRPEMALYQKLVWHDFTAADLFRQEQVKYYRHAICLVERSREGHDTKQRSFAATSPLRPHPHQPPGKSGEPTRRAPQRKTAPFPGEEGDLLEGAKRTLRRFLHIYCPHRARLSELDGRIAAVFGAIERFVEERE